MQRKESQPQFLALFLVTVLQTVYADVYYDQSIAAKLSINHIQIINL